MTPFSWLQAALRAVKAALKYPVFRPFLAKVSDRIAPGYSEIITDPMSFGEVQSKLEVPGGYQTAKEVLHDVQLVSSYLLYGISQLRSLNSIQSL